MGFDSYLRFIVFIAALAGLGWHWRQYRRGGFRTAEGEISRAQHPREFAIEAVQGALMLAFALAASLAGGRWFDALLPFLLAWVFGSTALRAGRTGTALTMNGTVRRDENPARYKISVGLTAALGLFSAVHALLRLFTYG